MKVEQLPELSVEEFADKHRLEIVVRERPKRVGDPMRFYADLDHTESMETPGFLSSVYGNGATVEEAVLELGRNINLKRLCVDAMRPSRREISPHRIRT